MFLYAGISVLSACLLLLITSGSGVPFFVYLGIGIAIVLSLLMLMRQRHASQSSYKKKKLVELEGEIERGNGYFAYYTLASLPIFLPTAWRKEFKKSKGRKTKAEGYLSESGYFYPVEVQDLHLSVEGDMRNGVISL